MTRTPTSLQPVATNVASPRWVLPVSILGSSLGFIDSSVVNIALPSIQSDLRVDLSSIQWISNAYLLTLASLILLGGALGDRYGTLRAFVGGLGVFIVASAACGLSPNNATLITARLVQGAGAAVLVPTSLALISQAYTGEARGKAIGTWAGAGGVLMALGPTLGGWAVDTIGWRFVFFINVPIGALALLLSRNIAESRQGDPSRRLDMPGSVLAVATLALFTYSLIEVGSDRTIGLVALALSLMTGAVFWIVETREKSPILPMRLFASRSFTAANLLTIVLYGGLGGAVFILPFHLLRVHGYSATEAGAAFLPFSLILGLGSPFAGGLSAKVGPRGPMTGGPILTAGGFALLGISASVPGYWLGYFPGLVLAAVGMTITIPALTTIVFDAAPEADSNAASGINNAAARSGGLIAVAAVGLAFGGSDIATLEPSAISAAYATVMIAATLSALVSGLVALWAIPSRDGVSR